MPSKWLDFAPIADWTDIDKAFLITCLKQIKEACDERNAVKELAHEPDWTDDTYKWPFNEGEISLTSETVDGLKKIFCTERAILPEDIVVTDSIQTSGTVSASSIPEDTELTNLLSSILGYGNGQTICRNDTSNGTEPALMLKTWVKQWFEVLNYTKYINRRLGTLFYADYITSPQSQKTYAQLYYIYNYNTNTFNRAILYLDEIRIINHYVAGELNEVAPFSTVAECLTYVTSKLDGLKNTTAWGNGGSSSRLENDLGYLIDKDANEIEIRLTVASDRLRFKVADQFRPALADGNYTVPIMWNGYNGKRIGMSSYSDFGAGITQNEVEFKELTADGSDFFYLGIDSPDWTVPTPATIPAGIATNNVNYQNTTYSLTPNMGLITNTNHSIYLDLNKADGTGFEYYTP